MDGSIATETTAVAFFTYSIMPPNHLSVVVSIDDTPHTSNKVQLRVLVDFKLVQRAHATGTQLLGIRIT